MIRFRRTLLACFVALSAAVTPLRGYSVLSHEAIVDALWDVKLRPFLQERFPKATAEDLQHAHGFAYGGAIIQDLGYYPQANKEFSDLTHYVRTGAFTAALLADARDLNELAFALGALSHYVSDMEGHRNATNRAEPLLYPALLKRFGPIVTYEDDPASHLKTEFGFDVLQVARGNFAPEGYHAFIGFYVAKDLVARAFEQTYGLPLSDLFDNFDWAVASCRATVSRTIPLATRVAWAQKKNEIRQVQPGVTHRRFVYIMRRSSYEREWGRRVNEPNAFEKFLALLARLIPPIGPLGALRLKIPTPEVEQLFQASFNESVSEYQGMIEKQALHQIDLPDKNFDVGAITLPGAYHLNDEAMAFWLHRLAEHGFATVTPPMKRVLLAFYADPSLPIDTKKDSDEWRQTLDEISRLKAR